MNSPEDHQPEQEILFNEEAIDLCDKIMKNKIKIKQQALKLKKNWINNKIIDFDTLYGEVSNITIDYVWYLTF